MRTLFDWLIIGRIMPFNFRGARAELVVKTGKTPALDAAGWRRLIGSIPTAALRDLRDWAPIATLRNPFAYHRGADLGDRRPKGTGSEIRLHEKGRTHHVMPCHYADEPGTRPMPGG